MEPADVFAVTGGVPAIYFVKRSARVDLAALCCLPGTVVMCDDPQTDVRVVVIPLLAAEAYCCVAGLISENP